ncbi:MAG: hypothetical protein HY976_02230 [Candidatus Kerfeldbacteria bacterium]|nr:hypothetical protein [Candidatus Kerfeldbacteria bacterium]
MKYLIGLAVIGVGLLLVIKTEWLVNNLGRIEWAEQHLGVEGGTRIFYKIFGVILILFAFLAMIGAFNSILTNTFGGAFKDTVQEESRGDSF